MDANLLASKQSADMNSTYGSQLAGLYDTQQGDIFKQFQDIQSIFDSQKAAQSAAADKAMKEGQTWAWKYSMSTGQLYLYDPATGQVKAAHDPNTGKPIFL